MIKFLTENSREILVGVSISLIIGVITFFFEYIKTGIANTFRKKKAFMFKIDEEEITFEEKLRSLKMDIIKIAAHDHSAGIHAEYAWIKEKYPKSKVRGQALMKHEIKVSDDKKRTINFDVIYVKLNDGREKAVYFEIDSFFSPGKPSSFEPGYFDQKIKDIYS